MDRGLTRLRDGVWECAVAPDGKAIAFVGGRWQTRDRGIWLMDADGANARRVTPEGRDRSFDFLSWSPAGGRLAYKSSIGSSGTYQNVIETCDLRGGRITRVFSDPWLGAGWGLPLRGMCWLKDGRLVFYLPDSTSPGICDLWALPLDPRDGTPRGRPARMLRTTGSYVADLTVSADGTRLACLKGRVQFDVYLAALLEDGRAIGPPRRLTLDEHTDMIMGWTPDSRAVYFLSTRADPPTLFQQGIDDRIATPLLAGLDVAQIAAFTPDGAWILYHPHRPPNHDAPLTRMPAGGGPAAAVADLDSAVLAGCGSRAGTPCVLMRQVGDELTFLEIDPRSGTRKAVARISWERQYRTLMWSLSHDGRHVACGNHVVDLRSGRRTYVRVKGWDDAKFLCWAADGGLWMSVGEEAGGTLLLHSDLAGRARAVGRLELFELSGSPDGRWLAFSRPTHEANAWLIERF
jgi:hypothetical protein